MTLYVLLAKLGSRFPRPCTLKRCHAPTCSCLAVKRITLARVPIPLGNGQDASWSIPLRVSWARFHQWGKGQIARILLQCWITDWFTTCLLTWCKLTPVFTRWFSIHYRTAQNYRWQQQATGKHWLRHWLAKHFEHACTHTNLSISHSTYIQKILSIVKWREIKGCCVRDQNNVRWMPGLWCNRVFKAVTLACR